MRLPTGIQPPSPRQAAQVTSVGLSVSIGFVDESLWRSVEPGTPSPRRRLDAVPGSAPWPGGTA